MEQVNAAIQLGAYLSRCKDAANDLWTWLPSYAEKAETPDLLAIIEQAADEICRLKGTGVLEQSGRLPSLSGPDTGRAVSWRSPAARIPKLGSVWMLRVAATGEPVEVKVMAIDSANMQVLFKNERDEHGGMPIIAFMTEAVPVGDLFKGASPPPRPTPLDSGEDPKRWPPEVDRRLSFTDPMFPWDLRNRFGIDRPSQVHFLRADQFKCLVGELESMFAWDEMDRKEDAVQCVEASPWYNLLLDTSVPVELVDENGNPIKEP